MSGRRPHLTAVVGVCDEIELIERCLDHLESLGIDSIVVVDMLSRDGTREALRRRQSEGRLELVERNNNSDSDADYLAAGVERAKNKFQPDWILIQDADEFCLHVSGDLHEVVEAIDGDVVSIDRYNACLSDELLREFDGPMPNVGACPIWVAPLRLSRDLMDRDPTIAWSSAQPMPKVMARAAGIFGLAAGGHAVLDTEGQSRPVMPDPAILMVHVPFLSFPRFRRKIARAKSLIAADTTYFTGSVGWHWRRWIEIYDDGALEAEYGKQIVCASDMASLLSQSLVERADTFLRERVLAAGVHVC